MKLHKVFTTSNLLLFLLVFMIAVSLVKMGLAVTRIDVNADASYYLGITRVLLEGKTPLNDFPLGYTPLSFYMMMPLESIFGTSFKAAMIVVFCITLLNALIVYAIAMQHCKNRVLSAFASGLTLLLLTCLDGCRYTLEPFVLLYGLSSIYFLGKTKLRNTFVAGVMCFCAFWSKQYGLGFFILGIVYILSDNGFSRLSFKRIGILLFGFASGLAIFLLIFIFTDVDLSLLSSLSGGTYERDGIAGLLGAWKTTFIILPFLAFPLILMLVHPKQSLHIPLLIASFCGICGFLLQCYVRFYAHYMLLAMPFCVLLFVGVYSLLSKKRLNQMALFLLAASSFIPLYFSVQMISGLLEEDKRQAQIEIADTIDDFIPDGSSNVYASLDLLPTTLINNYNPPLLKKHGFSNGFVRKPEEVLEMLQVSDYCIISDRNLQKKEKYTSEVTNYLKENFNQAGEAELEPGVNCLIFIRK